MISSYNVDSFAKMVPPHHHLSSPILREAVKNDIQLLGLFETVKLDQILHLALLFLSNRNAVCFNKLLGGGVEAYFPNVIRQSAKVKIKKSGCR